MELLTPTHSLVGGRHPKNPHIRPLNRTIVLGFAASFVGVNLNLQAPRPVHQVHPHKRRHAKQLRMQALRKAERDWSCPSYRCPNTECLIRGSVHIEGGVLRLELACLTCGGCGQALAPSEPT